MNVLEKMDAFLAFLEAKNLSDNHVLTIASGRGASLNITFGELKKFRNEGRIY